MGDLFAPSHILIVLVVALLIFGPRRLPELGGAVGNTIREFQRSMKAAGTAAEAPAEEAPGVHPVS